jgi:phosphoribosylanthranilate isomerase
MQSTKKPRVKICCISSVEEARLAIECGASALGLVSAMPSGPGIISDETVTAIAAEVPPPVATFLLTSLQDAASVIEQQRRCRTNTIQLVDSLTGGSYDEIREALPGISIVQVVHVTGPRSVEEAVAIAEHVDAILLDSGNPSLATKELGGTGRRHDWKLSRQIREQIGVPLFLAGGLNAANVQLAIEEVAPFALDICTGVRSEGKLDRQKLQALFHSVNSACVN